MQDDAELQRLRKQVYLAIAKYRYTYNFTWFGRPIIQLPDDIVAVQEIILSAKPDLVVETGVAHGGSLMLSASMLELLGGSGETIGIDIEIRPHNRSAIDAHPLRKRIRLIEGSSISDEVVEQVRRAAAGKLTMVMLDSNHSHAHVQKELELYSPLVGKGSYLVVFDTAIEDMPAGSFPDRPWDRGNNPKTAVWDFLKKNDRFVIDRELEDTLLFSVAPDGYLKCIRD